jgi:hypothetical protein
VNLLVRRFAPPEKPTAARLRITAGVGLNPALTLVEEEDVEEDMH